MRRPSSPPQGQGRAKSKRKLRSARGRGPSGWRSRLMGPVGMQVVTRQRRSSPFGLARKKLGRSATVAVNRRCKNNRRSIARCARKSDTPPFTNIFTHGEAQHSCSQIIEPAASSRPRVAAAPIWPRSPYMATRTGNRGPQWRCWLSRAAGNSAQRACGTQARRQICAPAKIRHGLAKGCTPAAGHAFATNPASSTYLNGQKI